MESNFYLNASAFGAGFVFPFSHVASAWGKLRVVFPVPLSSRAVALLCAANRERRGTDESASSRGKGQAEEQ